MFLSKHAKHVHIVIRRDSLKDTMSDYLITRINSSEKITLHTHTEITKLQGDKHLEGIELSNSKTNEIEKCDVRHVFLMIGTVPHTDWIKDCVKLDDKGFICTGVDIVSDEQWPLDRTPMMLESSQPGVYAAGDVRSGSVKRVASGVGEGAMSVSHVHGFLAEVGTGKTDKKAA